MILLTIILPQNSGRTALMLAAMEGDLDTVRFLISAGADASITDQVCNKVIFIGFIILQQIHHRHEYYHVYNMCMYVYISHPAIILLLCLYL